jgi:hypothetical protein
MTSRVSLVKHIAVVFSALACSASTEPEQLAPPFARIADCVGPARSLDPAIVATLPPRDGSMNPDHKWADLAQRVPGGFAGILLVDSKPVLMLTDPARAAAAKEALAPEIAWFDIRGAEVRKARWDFAQLVDWYTYLSVRSPDWLSSGWVSGDKDEAINRIRYGVLDSAALDELRQGLAAMELPCDLIALEITGPAIPLRR